MTITKRNGKFYCRFQINGERHHKLCAGATSLKEAEKIENAFKYKIQQQQNGVIPKEPQKVKLQTLLSLYEAYSKVNKLSYGKDSFCKYIGQYFKPQTLVQDIKVQDIESFKMFLKNERKSSNSTINKYISALSKMYNLGIENGILQQNPVSKVKKFREDNFKIRFLTLDEERKMFKSLKPTNEHLRPILICALQTGMRRGEIFNLKWADIDFDYNFIEILKSKTGKPRKIPISKKLNETLLKINRVSEYVFINPLTNKPYTDIHNSFHTLISDAGINNFRFHDLRHTVATRMVEKGVPLPVVKDLLGHSKIDTTMRYTHVVPNQKIEAIEVLNSYN